MDVEEFNKINCQLDRLENTEDSKVIAKKKRAIIANLFVPGLGYFVFGKSYFEGVACLLLFVIYNVFYFIIVREVVERDILYYFPAIIIWLVSMFRVLNLKEKNRYVEHKVKDEKK